MCISKNQHTEKNEISLHRILSPEQCPETIDHENSILLHTFGNAWSYVIFHHCRHVVAVIWNEYEGQKLKKQDCIHSYLNKMRMGRGSNEKKNHAFWHE